MRQRLREGEIESSPSHSGVETKLRPRPKCIETKTRPRHLGVETKSRPIRREGKAEPRPEGIETETRLNIFVWENLQNFATEADC